MPLSGDAKAAWMRPYMREYMRRKRAEAKRLAKGLRAAPADANRVGPAEGA
jgi:hypothetical protein